MIDMIKNTQYFILFFLKMATFWKAELAKQLKQISLIILVSFKRKMGENKPQTKVINTQENLKHSHLQHCRDVKSAAGLLSSTVNITPT